MSHCLYFPATAARFVKKDSPHQNVFKLNLSQKSFYVFRKDRQCKFIFLLSPSLDLINITSIRALEAMKVKPLKPCREASTLHQLPALIHDFDILLVQFFNCSYLLKQCNGRI